MRQMRLSGAAPSMPLWVSLTNEFLCFLFWQYTSSGGDGACDECEVDWWLNSDGVCKKCPSHATCTGGKTLPRPKRGYWSDRSDPELAQYIYKCSFETCRPSLASPLAWPSTSTLHSSTVALILFCVP